MSFADLLRTTTDQTTSTQVAKWIAGGLLESDAQPYCFAINHDIRPPKCEACPLEYHWSLRNQVGIDTMHRFEAWEWIVKALVFGYSVGRANPRTHHVMDAMTSVNRERSFAKLRREANDGDDVPF